MKSFKHLIFSLIGLMIMMTFISSAEASPGVTKVQKETFAKKKRRFTGRNSYNCNCLRINLQRTQCNFANVAPTG